MDKKMRQFNKDIINLECKVSSREGHLIIFTFSSREGHLIIFTISLDPDPQHGLLLLFLFLVLTAVYGDSTPPVAVVPVCY